MSMEAAGNPVIRTPASGWDGQDAPARRATLTRILIRIASEALQGAGLNPILQGICDCLVAELPVTIASVILLDEENENFVHEVYSGQMTTSPLVAEGRWPVGKGGAGRCARLGTPQLIADVTMDPDYVAGNASVRSEYLVPIRHGARLHGVLNIESTRTDFFDVESCDVFDAVAHLVAGAIHFARMAEELHLANKKLEQLSMRDGLTGIANRRHFDMRLDEAWSRLAGKGRLLALLMVDADAFKALNDGSGHLYGDECLCRLADICARFVQHGDDLVARFGGEELVLLLPDRDRAQAVAIAEQLRLAVEAERILHPGSSVAGHVTVSIGVGVLAPSADCPPERLVAIADRALYEAKQAGRNRVAWVEGH